MSLVRSSRSWLAPALGLTLWAGGTRAQESEVPPPPPIAAEPEPEVPLSSPEPSVATFPEVEEGAPAPVPAEPSAAVAPASEPAPEPIPPPAAAVVAPLAAPVPASTSKTELPAEAQAPAPQPAESSKVVHLYIGGGGVLAFGTSSSHQWSSNCPSISYGGETLNADCAIQSPIGGAFEGQLGLRGKYIGGEGFLFGAADYSYARLSFGDSIELPQFGDGTQIGRAGAGAGASVRGFYDAGKIGFSGAFGVGVIGRGIFTNLSVVDGSFEQYFASMIRFDAEITLLKFFQLGVYGWVEFAPDVVVRPDLSDFNVPPELASLLGEITVFQGTQVFIGPYLGFRTP